MVVQQITMLQKFMTSQFPVNSPSEKSGTYSKKTVAELKRLLDEKGIAYDTNALKADLIALLEGSG